MICRAGNADTGEDRRRDNERAYVVSGLILCLCFLRYKLFLYNQLAQIATFLDVYVLSRLFTDIRLVQNFVVLHFARCTLSCSNSHHKLVRI